MNELKWQAIAQAPKDGSWLIVIDKYDDLQKITWDEEHSLWKNQDSILMTDSCMIDFLFIRCPDFPRPKVMIDGNELLKWVSEENLTASYTALLYQIRAMIEEAQK